MTRAAIASLAILLTVAPAGAGVYYEAKTETEAPDRRGGDESYTVQAWVDGDHGKVLVSESGNQVLEKGTYLLTNDGGKTVYLVNPEEETYALFDLEALLSVVGQLDETTGGLVDIDFSDASSEVVSKGPGESLLGRPTTKVNWTSSFKMRMKIIGMKKETTFKNETEAWVDEDLNDLGFGVWLRKGPPKTGDEDFDAILRTGWQDFRGFPLKSIARTTSTNKKGKSQTTTTYNEVVVLRRESIAPTVYEIPSHFEQVTIVPQVEGDGDDDGGGNPLSGMFGGKKKKKKD